MTRQGASVKTDRSNITTSNAGSVLCVPLLKPRNLGPTRLKTLGGIRDSVAESKHVGTSMFILVILGQKCTLAASRAATW